MSAAPVPEWEDDLMGVANAAGVNPRLSIRTAYTDAEYAAVLATWARQAAPPFTIDTSIHPVDAPIDLVPTGWLDETTGAWVTYDHGPCEGDDCDRTICACDVGPCPGAVEQTCPHHMLLCDRCQDQCPDCVIDGQDDAGVLR